MFTGKGEMAGLESGQTCGQRPNRGGTGQGVMIPPQHFVCMSLDCPLSSLLFSVAEKLALGTPYKHIIKEKSQVLTQLVYALWDETCSVSLDVGKVGSLCSGRQPPTLS